MRMIGVLFTIGVLSGAMAIRAQVEQPALQGLPQYGVTLTGTLENAVLENHSGRVVIGYSMRKADANGRWAVSRQIMAETFLLPAGIPDGSSFALGKQVGVSVAGQGPIVTVTLRSVIFGDGQFVGVDEQGVFEQFGKELKVITEVGIMFKNTSVGPGGSSCPSRSRSSCPKTTGTAPEGRNFDHSPSARRQDVDQFPSGSRDDAGSNAEI